MNPRYILIGLIAIVIFNGCMKFEKEIATTTILQQRCVDTDGGRIYDVKGTNYITNVFENPLPETIAEDYCTSSEYLVEYYCTSNTSRNSETVECNCQNGTCVPITTTLCQLDQSLCNDQCKIICSPAKVINCSFDLKKCSCIYKCESRTTETTTTFASITTSTISKIIKTCADYCIHEGYKNGKCRLDSAECRTMAAGEVYKPKGNRYCPRGSPYDTCCCAL